MLKLILPILISTATACGASVTYGAGADAAFVPGG